MINSKLSTHNSALKHSWYLHPAGQRTQERAQGGAPVWTPPEGLPDIYIAMGQTAENVVQAEGITRQEMDEFAALSQQRAVANVENGFWEHEITPLTLPDGSVVSKDDGPRPGTTVEGLSQLKPVFRPDGSVTAGNSCPLNDGAAAVMVMSDAKARELGITPLARIVSSGVSALNPEIMGLGPIEASRQHRSDFGRLTTFDAAILRIETDDGLVGWGEGKNAAGSAGTYAGLVHLLNHEVAPRLIGRDPGDISAIWEMLYNGVRHESSAKAGHAMPELSRRGL